MRELKRRLPYSDFLDQFRHWLHFPWGDDWEQAATVAYFAHAPHARRPRRVEEIIPNRRPTRSGDRDREMWNILVKAAEAHNERLRRGGDDHNTEGTTQP